MSNQSRRKKMLEQLRKLVGEDHVWINEPMKNHTTFRAGGCADYLVEPKSVDAVREIVRLCCQENMTYYVVGTEATFWSVIKVITESFSIYIKICLILRSVEIT